MQRRLSISTQPRSRRLARWILVPRRRAIHHLTYVVSAFGLALSSSKIPTATSLHAKAAACNTVSLFLLVSVNSGCLPRETNAIAQAMSHWCARPAAPLRARSVPKLRERDHVLQQLYVDHFISFLHAHADQVMNRGVASNIDQTRVAVFEQHDVAAQLYSRYQATRVARHSLRSTMDVGRSACTYLQSVSLGAAKRAAQMQAGAAVDILFVDIVVSSCEVRERRCSE